MTTTRDAVLIETLRFAVPLYMDEMRDWSFERRAEAAHVATDAVAYRGDVLMYGGGRKGQVAEVFNHLARGLAAAAYQPGGVDFAGQHWCTDHDPCEHASARGAELTVEPPRPRRPVVDLELPA